MTQAGNPDIICRLKEIRNKKKITQTQLADLAGVKRQAIYDLESGRYLPNTSVALRLARILDCRVENIFYETPLDRHPVVLVDAPEKPHARVSIAKVRDKLYAYSLSGANSMTEEMKAADGLLEPGQTMVTLLKSDEHLENTALLLGCDPAFSILGHYVRKSRDPAQVDCRFASSGKAISLLAAGHAHMAGIHMHSTDSGDGNLDFARKSLKKFKGIVVAFSSFEEGFIVARGNPLNIQKPSDLAQEHIRFANREKGAALRALLDDCLKNANIPVSTVNGYSDTVKTHSEGAQRILHGICDAALGLRAVAEAFDLGFVPITQVRCDLVIPKDLLNHMGVKIALDILQEKKFRNELDCLPGYDSRHTGKTISTF